MIGMRYIGATVGPAGIGQQTALQKLQAKRAGISATLSSMQNTLASISSSIAQAHLDRISGAATNAAQAGLDRVNVAKNAAITAAQQRLNTVA